MVGIHGSHQWLGRGSNEDGSDGSVLNNKNQQHIFVLTLKMYEMFNLTARGPQNHKIRCFLRSTSVTATVASHAAIFSSAGQR